MSRAAPFDPRAFLQARNQGRTAPPHASPASPQILGVDSDDDFPNLSSSFATLAPVSPPLILHPSSPNPSETVSSRHPTPSPSAGQQQTNWDVQGTASTSSVPVSLPPGHTGHQTPSEVVQNQLFTGYAVPPRLPAARGRRSGVVPPPGRRPPRMPSAPSDSIPAVSQSLSQTAPPFNRIRSGPVPSRRTPIAAPDAVSMARSGGRTTPDPPRRPPNPIRRVSPADQQPPPRVARPPVRPVYPGRGPARPSNPSPMPHRTSSSPGPDLAPSIDPSGAAVVRQPSRVPGPPPPYRPGAPRGGPMPARADRTLHRVVRRPLPVPMRPRWSATTIPLRSAAAVSGMETVMVTDHTPSIIDQMLETSQDPFRTDDDDDAFMGYRSPSPLSLPAPSQAPTTAAAAATVIRTPIPDRPLVSTTTSVLFGSGSEVGATEAAPGHVPPIEPLPSAPIVSSSSLLSAPIGDELAPVSGLISPSSRRSSPAADVRESQSDLLSPESPSRPLSRDRSIESHWLERGGGARRLSPRPGSISDERRQQLLQRAKLISQRHQDEVDGLKQQIQKLKASQRSIPIADTTGDTSSFVIPYDDCLPYAFGENSRLVRRALDDQLDNNARLEAMLSKLSLLLESGTYPETLHEAMMRGHEARHSKIVDERLASAQIRIQDLIQENHYLSKQLALKEERMESVQEESRLLIDTLRQSLQQETFERKRMNALYDEERNVLNASLRDTIQNLAADNQRLRLRLADAGLPHD